MAMSFGSADIPMLKKSFSKFVAMGEKASAADFRLTVDKYPDLEFLCKSVQVPPLKREMMEIKGPHGVQVQQQGVPINAHEIPITFTETIDGHVMAALRDWVKNKRYLTVTIEPISEAGRAKLAKPVTMEYCWIESDAVEYSTEDSTAPLNIAGTLHCNWPNHFE